MPRRRPRFGLAARVAIILFGAVLLVQAALVIMWFSDLRQDSRDLFERVNLRRIVATTRLLDQQDTAPKGRFGLLAAVNSPTLQVRLSPTPPTDLSPFGPDHVRQDIARRVSRALDGRPVRVEFEWGRMDRHRKPHRDRRHHKPRWYDDGDDDGPPSRQRRTGKYRGLPDCDPSDPDDCPEIDAGPEVMSGSMKAMIHIPLQSGNWAHFTATLPDTNRAWLWRLIGWNLLAALIAAGFAFFAARHLTRPLAGFAKAADRFGRDMDADPLDEKGAPEMRRAARAFNTMQARLKRFIADRALMVAAVSHDLRTMLTRLRLRAEFIDDEEQRKKAFTDLDDMAAMLNATLAFARDDAADEPTEPVDLASLVSSLCDDLSDAGQQVTYDGPASAVLTLRPRAMRRVFANLLDNAVKYGELADVTLTDETDRVIVTVADRGPGIPFHQREDVFRPFFRLEESRNRETGGTGLGLAVVRGIVHRHGGDIELKDRDGGGLEVVVMLPR